MIKKVADLIKALQQMPPDADVYYGSFDGYLSDHLQPIRVKDKDNIPDKESHTLFPIDCEHKTVYCWSVKRQCFVSYTGVIIEINS